MHQPCVPLASYTPCAVQPPTDCPFCLAYCALGVLVRQLRVARHAGPRPHAPLRHIVSFVRVCGLGEVHKLEVLETKKECRRARSARWARNRFHCWPPLLAPIVGSHCWPSLLARTQLVSTTSIKDSQLLEIKRTVLSEARFQCALYRFSQDHPHAYMIDQVRWPMVIWHLASISACANRLVSIPRSVSKSLLAWVAMLLIGSFVRPCQLAEYTCNRFFCKLLGAWPQNRQTTAFSRLYFSSPEPTF